MDYDIHETHEMILQLTIERDLAVKMLADWCVDVEFNGSGWDDWDENFKDAAYRESPIRGLLDKAIKVAVDELNETIPFHEDPKKWPYGTN